MLQVTVDVDQRGIDGAVREEISKRIDKAIVTQTLWDMKELSRQTNMSIPFIKEKFFYDKEFPKYKVGTKWYMPAVEASEYIVAWLKRQPRN